MRIRFLALILVLAPAALAQFDPEDAEVISYYPHVADGGPAVQRWTTTFTFVNPHSSQVAGGAVHLYDNTGHPLALDFGNGPQSTLNFAIPPQGSVQFQSTGAPTSIVTGWAMVTSTLPVEGVLRLSFLAKGVPQQGAAEPTTKAASLFRSAATNNTGIAIANVSATSLTVTVSAVDGSGHAAGLASVTLPALGHTAATVAQLFPSLPSSFKGSVVIATTVPGTFCAAWTLSSDLGVIAALPPSGLGWPASQYERIWKVWNKLLDAAVTDFPMPVPPKLVIDPGNNPVNALAQPSANDVIIFVNLAEMMSDSDSELGYVIGHELGHILQSKMGRAFVLDMEQDADDWAIVLALQAGYDPYGAAGALGKLSMASTAAGLLDPNFDGLQGVASANLSASFNSRLADVAGGMMQVCAGASYQALCEKYKTVAHPHVPSVSPGSVPGNTAPLLP